MAWGNELIPPGHINQCVHALEEDYSPGLGEQDNDSPILARISKETRSKLLAHEKKALAHTVKECHRRLRISYAIKQIADLLGIHCSKGKVESIVF